MKRLQRMIANCILLLLFVPHMITARPIDSFYGTIDVDEPVILELIDSPAFQRLKSIHQYGIGYYTNFNEEYNRYDHSIGVFVILRLKGSSLTEQIAGLLHDVSHTTFSHVGDWVYGKENHIKDYQNDIHESFLKECELGEILNSYGFNTDQILPLEELFPALESQLPNLCADRIDYNIQGAYHQGFITHDEALTIFNDLRYIDNRWVSNEIELMKKLTRASLYMTQSIWGGVVNYLNSRWFADVILKAIDCGVISSQDFQLGTDQIIWDTLNQQIDSFIVESLARIQRTESCFEYTSSDNADIVVVSKFRGIDPWVIFEGKCSRLTLIDPVLSGEFYNVKEIVQNGWPIKFR